MISGILRSMFQAPFWSLCYEYYHALGQFRTDYRDTFDKEPFIEATPSFYLYDDFCSAPMPWATMLTFSNRNIGANITEDEYNVYLAQLDTFKAWFNSTVMSLSYEQPDDAIMVLPCGADGPGYRDTPPE